MAKKKSLKDEFSSFGHMERPKKSAGAMQDLHKQAEQREVERQALVKQNLEIHSELKPYIPPLKKEELERLEENIIDKGRVTEPLLVWETPEGRYFLLDGHNRLSIIRKHEEMGIDLKWKVEVRSDLQTLDDAKRLMRDIQLGRRNLTPLQTAYLRGKTYLDMKKESNRPEGSEEASGNTRDILAMEFKVSAKTIQRDAAFAKGLDRFLDASLSEQIREEWEKILTGESLLRKSDVSFLGIQEDLSLELVWKFIHQGGSLDDLQTVDKDRWEDFLRSSGQTAVSPVAQEIEEKPRKANSSPAPPADRFNKWWNQEERLLSKLIQKGDQELLAQKRQEIEERMEKLKLLLERCSEI
jgi:hypothetical protein